MNVDFRKQIRMLIIGVILLLYVGVWFWILQGTNFFVPTFSLFHKPVANQSADINPESSDISDSTVPETPDQTNKKVFTEFTDNDVRRGQIEWQEPKDVGDLGWTSKAVYWGTFKNDEIASGGMHYVKVGKVVAGKYSGADVIVVAAWFSYGGPQGNNPGLEYYLLMPNQTVYLPYADTQNNKEIRLTDLDWKRDESLGEMRILPPHEMIDTETRIEELASYPDEFQGENDRQVFMRIEYGPDAFFTDQGLKKAFTHQKWGDVWMVDTRYTGTRQVVLNRYIGKTYKPSSGKYITEKKYFDPLVAGGIYVRRPDGIVIAYRLKFDIFEKFDRSGLLSVTWSDRTENTTEYEEYPSGCGLAAYAYDETGKWDILRDLRITGKTSKGDNLYEPKDINNKITKQLFENVKNGYATAHVSTLSDLAAMHPFVLWQDPLGRLLAFYNTDIIPLAECGKPVIYLYPEQKTDVSVQVFPTEGVSISDPPYHQGWRVQADPDGTLLNQDDGKKYSSLFWEGGSDIPYQTPEQGFVTAQKDLQPFFDEKLTQLGLRGKEIADFEEFWIPKMQEDNHPYYFVTFLSRPVIDRLAPLQITPQPDTTIRVMMDYEGLDVWKPVEGFRIRTPQRHGFTAVEWGGRLKH